MISLVLAIRIFQLFVIVLTAIHFIREKCWTDKNWQYFRISNWVFRLCALVAFGLSFGIAAVIEERAADQYGIAVLFGAACIFSAVMMSVQSIWQIKYRDEQLIFRNSFGKSQTYSLNELTIAEQGRMTLLKHRNKTVTKWDSSIMNVKQEIVFQRAISIK